MRAFFAQLCILLACLGSVPAFGQDSYPPGVTKSDLSALQSQLATLQSTAVTSVNSIAPTGGNVALSIPSAPDLSGYALKTQLPDLTPYALKTQVPAAYSDAQAVAANTSAITTALAPYVKTVNGTSPTSGNVTLAIPTQYTDAMAVTANTSAIATAVAPTIKYITGFTLASPGLKASLPTCGGGSAPVGSYAVVSDLYSTFFNTNEAMRCGQTGTISYWRPVRTDVSVSMATPTGAVSLLPNFTPPIVHFNTAATASFTVTPSTVGAFPGETFDVIQDGALGLFSFQVGGVIGNLANVLTGGMRRFTYSCTAVATPVCAWTSN